LQNGLLQRIFAKLGLQNFCKVCKNPTDAPPQLLEQLRKSGWRLYLSNVRGRTYLRAYNGAKWVSLGRVGREDVELLRSYGLIPAPRRPRRKAPVDKSSSKGSRERVLQSFAKRGVGGGFANLFVHRLVLRFVRPWVSPVFLGGFGGVRFVGGSGQWVLRLGVGGGRWVTVQVNRDGTAQVFLEASDNPLGVEEFVGFCRFWLLWLFGRLTGRCVSLSDFVVVSAPEFNVDLPGVNLLEGIGVGGKSLTLEEYAEGLVRVYWKASAATMPEGGTRVEYRPGSLKGASLKDLVDGVVAQAELPKLLTDLRKDLELIRSGLSRFQVERNALAEVVAAKLANLLDLLFKRLEERLRSWISELASRIASTVEEYVRGLRTRIRELEDENRRLRRRLEALEVAARMQDLRTHPAWGRLEGLARPTDSRPALVKINLRDGYVALSDDLWRYVMSRTPAGTRRGLDRELLERVRAFEGPEAAELLLAIQRLGRLPLRDALNILSGSKTAAWPAGSAT